MGTHHEVPSWIVNLVYRARMKSADGVMSRTLLRVVSERRE